VIAGAAAALQLLGLNDAVDVVYGSSAGTKMQPLFNHQQAVQRSRVTFAVSSLVYM
jgi:hypothetical protein